MKPLTIAILGRKDPSIGEEGVQWPPIVARRAVGASLSFAWN
jgi:hypothetical protein